MCCGRPPRAPWCVWAGPLCGRPCGCFPLWVRDLGGLRVCVPRGRTLPRVSQASRTLLCPYMSVDAVQSCAAVPATKAWALPAGQERGGGGGGAGSLPSSTGRGFGPGDPRPHVASSLKAAAGAASPRTPPRPHAPQSWFAQVWGGWWRVGCSPHVGGPGPSPGPLCAGDSESLRGKEGALSHCPTRPGHSPSGGDPKPHCRERSLPAIASPGGCRAWRAKGRGLLPPAQSRGISSRCPPAGGNPSTGRPVQRLRLLPTEVVPAQSPKSLHYFSVNRAFPSQSHQHFCVAPHLALIGPASSDGCWSPDVMRRGRPLPLLPAQGQAGGGVGGGGRTQASARRSVCSLPGPGSAGGVPGSAPHTP
uniref:Uncharacterized protein n=1 Tax=Mustela putorius furo TaxID=9669 RepID=M3Z807_MUSPF